MLDDDKKGVEIIYTPSGKQQVSIKFWRLV
jgi:hypothetical protein